MPLKIGRNHPKLGPQLAVSGRVFWTLTFGPLAVSSGANPHNANNPPREIRLATSLEGGGIEVPLNSYDQKRNGWRSAEGFTSKPCLDNEGPHFEKVGFFSGILKSFEGSSNTSLKHFIILYPQTKNRGFLIHGVYVHKSIDLHHTVDGRNPTPVDMQNMENIPFFIGFHI